MLLLLLLPPWLSLLRLRCLFFTMAVYLDGYIHLLMAGEADKDEGANSMSR